MDDDERRLAENLGIESDDEDLDVNIRSGGWGSNSSKGTKKAINGSLRSNDEPLLASNAMISVPSSSDNTLRPRRQTF